MKCLGLIGGIGWEATASYYQLINENIRRRFGSMHSARLVIDSLSFDPLDTLIQLEDWKAVRVILQDSAKRLEGAGAEALLICSNPMHFLAEDIQAAVKIPLLHVGTAIGQSLGRTRDDLGLLGARFTMERGFILEAGPDYPHWRKRRVHVPDDADCEQLDHIIYRELCRGLVRDESKAALLRMAKALRAKGARRVVLAASELARLIDPATAPLWLDDSTELHAAAAVRWALGEIKRPADFTRASMSDLPGEPLIKRSRLAAVS